MLKEGRRQDNKYRIVYDVGFFIGKFFWGIFELFFKGFQEFFGWMGFIIFDKVMVID